MKGDINLFTAVLTTLCTCSSMATRGSLEPLLHAYVQRDEPKEEMICASQSKQFQSEICYNLVFNVVRFPLKKKIHLLWCTDLELHSLSEVCNRCESFAFFFFFLSKSVIRVFPPRSAAVGEVSERPKIWKCIKGVNMAKTGCILLCREWPVKKISLLETCRQKAWKSVTDMQRRGLPSLRLHTLPPPPELPLMQPRTDLPRTRDRSWTNKGINHDYNS